MNASASVSHPDRTAPLALWRVAEAFLATLYMLFGAPEDVAGKHTLLADAHARLASWLRCGEAFLRRLLLIEAAAYPKPNTRPMLRTQRKRTRKALGFDADKPEAWRVSFRCLMERRRPRRRLSQVEQSTPARTPALHGFRSAWPLAERYEALIRVFNNPAPYARRLAERLHATPHRIEEVLHAPEDAVHRIDQFEAAGEQGMRAWPAPYRNSG